MLYWSGLFLKQFNYSFNIINILIMSLKKLKDFLKSAKQYNWKKYKFAVTS